MCAMSVFFSLPINVENDFNSYTNYVTDFTLKLDK